MQLQLMTVILTLQTFLKNISAVVVSVGDIDKPVKYEYWNPNHGQIKKHRSIHGPDCFIIGGLEVASLILKCK